MATKKTSSNTQTLSSLKAELYVLSMKHQAGELKQTHELSRLRKEIARFQTAQNSPTTL